MSDLEECKYKFIPRKARKEWKMFFVLGFAMGFDDGPAKSTLIHAPDSKKVMRYNKA